MMTISGHSTGKGREAASKSGFDIVSSRTTLIVGLWKRIGVRLNVQLYRKFTRI